MAEVLQLLPTNDKQLRTDRLEHQVRRKGFVNFGIPGETNALFAAMAWGTPEIVQLLLQTGASPMVRDRNGFDPFMYACYYGRVENMKAWLGHLKNWDLSRRINATGANALTLALNQGPHKKETLQFLLNAGMDTNTVASSGTTYLIAACGNVDSDPELVRMILDSLNAM